MTYQIAQLGNMSGGMNDAFPPSRIREDQCSLLENMEYLNNNTFPQTRRGTNFLATVTDDGNNCSVVGIHPFQDTTDTTESHLMVVTTTNAPLTRWLGRQPGGSFTSRGTVALATADWHHEVMGGLLILASPTATSVAKTWAGGAANVNDLGGSPPNPIYCMGVWNNRLFAVSASDR